MERHAKLLCTLLSIMLQLSTSGWPVRSQSACPDEYVYTQQPPVDIVCNPYLNRKLMLDCAVTGPENIDIKWYFSRTSMDVFSGDTVQLMNSSKHVLTPRHLQEGPGVGVSLLVNYLNEQNDTGFYWCQAIVATDGTLLTQSGSFILYDYSFYEGIPFTCPENTFLRSSDTRCATVVIIEEEPDPTTLPPSISPTSSVVSTVVSLSSTSLSWPMSSSPLVLGSTISASAVLTLSAVSTEPPSIIMQTTAITSPPELSSTTPGIGSDPPSGMGGIESDLILYAVLGVVVFLLVLCVALGVVIFILCRKRCQRVDLEGTEKKGSKLNFDQVSAQGVVLRNGMHPKGGVGHTPYGANISMTISNSSRSPHASGDYAEIGVVMRTQDGTPHEYSRISDVLPPHIQNSNTDVCPGAQSRDENPYDVPSLLPEFQTRQENSVVESSGSHGYHILERIHSSTSPPTVSPPPPPADDEEIELTSPPLSPHDYHILEKPSSHPQFEGEDYLYPTTNSSTVPLTPIPEHPYHCLEEKSTSSSVDQESEEINFQIDPDIKEMTPGFTDPEIEITEITPDSRETSIDFDDGEYDRLVGPPCIYRILERSPPEVRPRIRELPTNYDRLDTGQAVVQSSGQGVRFLSPQTEETTISILSGHTGLSSGESDNSGPDPDPHVFDDPQYTFSPKRKVPVERTMSELGGVHPVRQRSRGYHAKDLEDINLTKYSGDYERDPCYMAQLRKMSSGQNRARAAEDCTDYASYSRLSALSNLRGGSSLPDIPHVYQTLAEGTRDPLQPYEKVKRHFQNKETAI